MSLQAAIPASLSIGLVEDSDEDFVAFSRVVERDAPGTTLVRWARAEAVLEELDGEPRPGGWPHIMVVDLNLPGMDGCELVRRLRATPATRGLPAVVLSGSGRQHDIDRCYAAGANAYLTKPNSSRELGALLKMLFSSIMAFRAPTPVGGPAPVETADVPEADASEPGVVSIGDLLDAAIVKDAAAAEAAGVDDVVELPLVPGVEEARAAYERQLLEERDAERRARERAEALQRIASRLANTMSAAQIEAALVHELVDGGRAREAKVLRPDAGGPRPVVSFSADPTGPGTIGLLPLLGTSGSVLAHLRVELDTELGEEQEAFLHEVASLARMALERIARLSTMMRQSTGIAADLPTRRWLSSAVSLALREATSSGKPLTMVAVEIDHFERYTETHGHVSADSLLLAVTDAWRRAGHDLLSRTGAEQFIALMGDLDDRAALEVIREIRRQPSVKHAFSAGVAQWNRREDASQLLARAEAAVAVDRQRVASA